MLKPPNPLLDKFRTGQLALGSFVFSRDPAITEILAGTGFDLAIVDMEHAPLSISEVVDHVRAGNAAGISCWVRVGGYDAVEVGKLLDLGAQGILFPHYGMPSADADAAFSAVRYAPQGARPTCTGIRAAAYGSGDFAEFTARANDDVVSIGLIEDAAVIDRIDEVIEGCGLTAVMPGGAGDLATSLGLTGQGSHPRVKAAARRVIEAAKRKAGLKTGAYVSDAASAEEWRGLGVDFLVHSIDYKIIAKAFADIRASLSVN